MKKENLMIITFIVGLLKIAASIALLGEMFPRMEGLFWSALLASSVIFEMLILDFLNKLKS